MLQRAALRSLQIRRPLIRPNVLQSPTRAYAKVGKPKPPQFIPPSHSAPHVASPKSTQSPSPIPNPASRFPSDSNARPREARPISQDELDSEAVDAFPSSSESRSKSAIGAQAEPLTSASPSEQADFETEKHTTPRERPQAGEEGHQQIPLHDLTKGLPSTLEAELEEAAKRQRRAEGEEEVEEQPRPSSGGRGDRPVRDYTTSAERRRNRLMAWAAASFGLMFLAWPVYLGRNWENEEEARLHPDVPNGWGFGLFFSRLKARLSSTVEYYSEPAFPKLLPDMEPQFERPYTLVLSLEDLLVHSEWTREYGWRLAKRPGLDYFLRYLSSYYELVVFTSQPMMIGEPVLRKLEPFGIIPWRLFREGTRYKDGAHIKDLSFLNRPIDKIISIDTDPSHVSAQPENAIILPKWTGDPQDKELIALIPFLEYTAAMGLDDTRKVIASFDGKHIPTEFALREAEARKRFEAQMAEERKKRPRRGGLGSLGSKLGMGANSGLMSPPPGEMSLTEGFEKGMMLHDIIRARGQKAYEALDKEIRENTDEWMKLIAADDEKNKEEGMKQMKEGVMGWFAGGRKSENDPVRN